GSCWLPMCWVREVAVPQVALGGTGAGLARVAGQDAMAEEPLMDVGDEGAVVRRHGAQRGVELRENLDPLGPCFNTSSAVRLPRLPISHLTCWPHAFSATLTTPAFDRRGLR
ncbi:MAG: hypothetical protein M3O70_00070, partial [Actinomycetota bacterium]|nr:hypothetical protein [Actinomycetota bacterium]